MILNPERRLILASGSPRRLQLLQQIGLSPEIIVSEISEDKSKSDSAEQIARNLSLMKASHVAKEIDDGIIIGADTVVTIQGKILGKPANRDEAHEMLRTLSGNKHSVFTAFTIYSTPLDREFTEIDKTDVFFKAISDEEIYAYIDLTSPYDKAGAYGIQDDDADFIEKIEGSYDNVVGFPLASFQSAFSNPTNREYLNLV